MKDVSEVHESNGSQSFEVIETNVLQERTIGVFGAISLIVNKIIGAGYVIQ